MAIESGDSEIPGVVLECLPMAQQRQDDDHDESNIDDEESDIDDEESDIDDDSDCEYFDFPDFPDRMFR